MQETTKTRSVYRYIIEAAGCLDFADSIEGAVAKVAQKTYLECEIAASPAWRQSRHPHEDEEHIEALATGESLKGFAYEANKFRSVAKAAEMNANVARLAANATGQAVGIISRKKAA